jgi:uncharacterized protein YheU (UPF0270 family)
MYTCTHSAYGKTYFGHGQFETLSLQSTVRAARPESSRGQVVAAFWGQLSDYGENEAPLGQTSRRLTSAHH